MATIGDIDQTVRLEAECAELRQRVAKLEAERLALIAQYQHDRLTRTLAGKIPGQLELPFEHDGKPGCLVDLSAPLRDEAGRVAGVIATVQDVTERRGAHHNQREIAQRLGGVLEATSDAFMDLDRDLVVRYFNAAAERLLGRSRSDVVGRQLFDAFPEARGSIFEEHYTRAASEKVAVSFEVNFDVPPYRNWYNVRVFPTGDGISVFFQVTTERREMEAKLRDRDRVLADILESTLSGYWDWNIPAGTEYMSPTFKKMFGYEDDELPNSPDTWQRLIFADDLPGVLEIFNRHVKSSGREPYYNEVRYRHKDGSTVWVICAGRVIEWAEDGSPVRMVGCHIDVTERKVAQEALRHFQMAVDNATDAIGMSTPEGRHYYQNEAFTRLFGLSAAEVEGESGPPSTVYVDERTGRAIFETIRAGGTYIGEVQMYDKNRKVHDIFLRGYPIKDNQARVVGLVGVHTDITERKKVERDLHNTIRTLDESQDVAALGSYVFDPRANCWTSSRGLDKIFGITDPLYRRDLAGWAAIVHPDDRDAMVAYLSEEVIGNKHTFDRQYRIVRLNDKAERWVHGLGRLTLDTTGKVVSMIGTIQDVTDRIRADREKSALQEQLHHAHKMEAVGTLAGGVAHDFNNILGGVMNGLSLLELELGDADNRYCADIKDMKHLVQRGAELSKQLLGFSRRGKYDVAPQDVREVVQKTTELFGRTRRDITLVLDFAPDLDRALVDHAQFEQVLLNLFINAAHAMPDGGLLAVRGENATITAEETEPHGAQPGRFVRLVVADTGTGIEPTILPRIFEPFFTTKDPGQGTGLGLASVYGIVKNHGGIVTVESEVGRGTAFTILLPATNQPSVERAATQAAVRPGRGTILVVDDEELVRKICARLLVALGYEVLTASGGQAAVDVVRQHHEKISLVILDLTMPEMTGAATFDAIREIAPTLKVLLASGFSVDGQAQALLDRGCNGFIQKPFDLAALSEKLQALR